MTRVAGSLRRYRLQAVDASRIAVLYGHALSGLAVTLAVALLAVTVLAAVIPVPRLAAWTFATMVVLLARLALVLRHRRRAAGVEPRRWENLFATGAALQGLLWAALVVGFRPLPPEYELFVAFVIGGMAIGAIGMLGASPRAFLLFTVPMVLVQAADFVRQGGSPHTTSSCFASSRPRARAVSGTVASVVRSPPPTSSASARAISSTTWG